VSPVSLALKTALFVGTLLLVGCRSANKPTAPAEMPQKMLWAWEREEDLKFIDPAEFGVAFLAQTVFLENDRVIPRQRRQPLNVPTGTYLIAVTRIETNKETVRRPKFDVAMVSQTAFLIKRTLELPNVRGIQIDFDAGASERDFYRRLATEVRRQLPAGTSFTITALASWCTGDAWFGDFPVDEAIPMVFQMGADSENIKTFIKNGSDWHEPLCRASYGISLEEGRFDGMQNGRRIFYFKNSPWSNADIQGLQ